MIYEKYSPGQIIVSEGDKSNNKFYVVLSGKVNILIRNNEKVFISENIQKKFMQTINNERHSVQENSPLLMAPPKLMETKMNFRKKSLNPQILTPISSEPRKKTIRIHPDNNKIEENYMENSKNLSFKDFSIDHILLKFKEMGYINKELEKGEGFGEVALLDSKARRTATVLALTNLELIVILKKDFLLIRQKFSKEYKQKKKFIVSVIPFLKTINSSSTLDNLIFSFKELILPHRSILINEGEKSEKIYFIMKGKCKIVKKFEFEINGIPQKRSFHLCDIGSN